MIVMFDLHYRGSDGKLICQQFTAKAKAFASARKHSKETGYAAVYRTEGYNQNGSFREVESTLVGIFRNGIKE